MDSTRVSERQTMKTIHRPGVIDIGSETIIGESVRRELWLPEIPCARVQAVVDETIADGVCVLVPPK